MIDNVLSLSPDPIGVTPPHPDTPMIQLAHGIYATRTGAMIDENVTLEDFAPACQTVRHSPMRRRGR